MNTIPASKSASSALPQLALPQLALPQLALRQLALRQLSTAWLLCTICLLATVSLALPAMAAEEVNRIVLQVNDRILTLYDYEKRKTAEIGAILADSRLSPAQRQESLAQIGPEVMQQIYREMLLESQAARTGITVSDREIDASIEQLRDSNNMTTLAELEEAAATQGMTLDDLRAKLRQDLLLSQLVRREVTGQIEVDDDTLRSYYRNHPEEFTVAEERHLREVIVLQSSGLSASELEAAAGQLQAKLATGADFAETVEAYAARDETTGVIDLGWLGRDEIGDELAEAAFSLPAGSYSPPIAARGGWHIVYVEEVKPSTVTDFAEVAGQIRAHLRQSQFSSQMQTYIAQLEASSFVEENLPSEAVGFRTVGDAFEPEDELRDFRAPLAERLSEEAADEAAEVLSDDSDS